jgi:hypothetical protein
VAKTQQKIWSCFTQDVIGKYIAKSWRLENRAAQAVFERLERNKAKVLRYVLRGTGSRNAPRLPGMVSLRQNGVGTGFVMADAILPKGHGGIVAGGDSAGADSVAIFALYV